VFRALAVVLVTTLLAACGPVTPADGPLAALGDDFPAWAAADGESREALDTGRYADAVRALEEKIALYPSLEGEEATSVLFEARAIDLYNLACARALSGPPTAALDALEAAMAGDRPIVGYEHLVDDPDLDSLRHEPRFKALMRSLSWNDDVSIYEPLGGGAGGRKAPWPVMVELDAGGEARPEDPKHRDTEFAWITVHPRAPFRVERGAWAWMTRADRGRQAAKKCAFSVELTSRQHVIDEDRVVLVAHGDLECGLAWRILAEDPGPFRHVVVDGAAPPAYEVMDRLDELARRGVTVWAVGEGSVPEGLGLDVRMVPSVDAALERIAL
jgi:hypothetical protein